MKIIKIFIPLIFLTCISYSKSLVNPFASSDARKGGMLVLHTSEFPKSFNLYVNNAADAALVFGLVYDSLLDIHPLTLEFIPLIADSWKVSADKKVFTFHIDRKAKWADGKPITARDVLFTYDTIMDTNNMTSVQRLFLSRFDRPEILDDYTIRFKASTVHYNNLVTLAGLNILPEHLYRGKDFNKSFNMKLPGSSGPYELTDVKEGRYYELTRRDDYWADVLPYRQGMYNFKKLRFKVIRDDKVAFEAFKKGDFDVFTDISPKRWVTETDSEKFANNWIIKQKVYNYAPRGIRGFAINMRKKIFQDIRVRKALFMLLDRKTILEKIMYNQMTPLYSYFPGLGGSKPYNEIINYNPERAKKLLREAGFTTLDKEGYLINSRGERLEFTISSVADETMEKVLTLFSDSCKKAGIKVNIDTVSWATLIKKLDNYDFDLVSIGWTGTLFPDPEQLWHSRHANEIGGSNLSGYKNKKVDSLINSLPPIFNAEQRLKIIIVIDKLIYKDVPYILFWGADYIRIFYKNCFGKPKTVFSKYGGTSDVIAYWWYEEEKVKRLREAERKKEPLPQEEVEVFYDRNVK